ncbi:MAG: mechanosensitive ion channel [Chloroflexi bacterium]|nr:mechanosensitive ion channel [Chloroflexota bacterium]
MTEILQEVLQQLQDVLVDILAFSPRLIIGGLVGLFSFFLARYLRRLTNRLIDQINAPVSVDRLIVNAVYITAILVGIIVTLAVLGVDVSTLVAGVGLSGLVIGFALRDIIENLVAGLLMLLERPFAVGDRIEVEDHHGFVVDVTLRHTVIRTYDNTQILIPNATVYTNVVKNHTHYPIRRRDVSFNIAYDQDLARAVSTMLEALRGVEGVAQFPAPTFAFDDMGETSILGRFYYYFNIEEYDWFEIQSRVVQAMQEAARSENIMIPGPNQIEVTL